jgi:RNA polymerase sigma factor (sigma-70 family)
MAELTTDQDLLRAYAETGSERAFQALVQRHLDLVFATALRGLHDAGAAQEVTQNVFISLARKASWLSGETSLAGWLHKAARLEVRRWWRGELRRQHREHTAAELGTVMKEDDSRLKALTGELDDALLELREADRQALMLRYFEGRTHREIGALLGAREDAVRMRIDKALARLTQLFRRRGYAVPAGVTVAAVLGAAAKAAPAGLAGVTTRAALAGGGGGTAWGLNLLLPRLLGLTKTQTTLLCATLAVAPLSWEWQVSRHSASQAADSQVQLEAAQAQLTQSASEVDQLRAKSARLEAALTEAGPLQARYSEAARKLAVWQGRLRGLLTDANYHWPEDLPYVRVSKATVKGLDLLQRVPATFEPSGALTEPALELFGITAQEKAPTEQALADYWRGVWDLSASTAYETNLPGTPAGRWTKTVIVPPLGQPLKALAEQTRSQLTEVLGADREKLVFDGWDQGAIQIFWPGNLWHIAEESQTFTVWVEPAATNNAPRYGAGWHQGGSGVSCDGDHSLDSLPRGIVARFFTPWLEQWGIAAPRPDGAHE